MPILPFGCRAFAVKPREAYSKTRIEPRAWVGINLGRSLSTPGAYSVYVPSVPRIVLTSEVYFDESERLSMEAVNSDGQLACGRGRPRY
eukprot:4106615-Pleurochrysis_carterae.AAC.1